MSKIKFTFIAFSFVALTLGLTSIAQAQANVVYVTANRGTDLNTCSRTSPCRSIQKGLDTVTAGGTVEILETGDYAPFTVNKSVTVEAAPGIDAVIIVPASTAGIIVTAAATTDRVVLRGLTVQGLPSSFYGINVGSQLSSLHIENCVVTGMGDTGIYLNAAGEYFIKETMVRNNTGLGIFFATTTGTVSGTMEHCRMENNGGTGLYVSANSTVVVRDSVSAGNAQDGFVAYGATADMTVENCLVTRNSSNGVFSLGSATVRVSNSTIVKNNTYGLNNFSSTLQSSGNNILGGNGLGATNGTITALPIG